MSNLNEVLHDCDGHMEGELRIDLVLTDRDVIQELSRRREPGDRESYAQAALKVGVLAIRQASGVIDTQAIQEEGHRLIETMRGALKENTDLLSNQVSTLLGKYFDPKGGEFPQRIDRLVRRDGELEALLSRHVNGDGSTLSHTLDKHLGPTSPLLKLLSPEQQQGLLACLKDSLTAVIVNHGRQIAGQFSLDEKESALSRLVAAITEKNGSLRQDLSKDLATVQREFSLDNDDGALSRLVAQFKQANQKILDEFSIENSASALVRMLELLKATNDAVASSLTLDDEESPLSRLQRGLMKVVLELKKDNEEFQKEVRSTLDSYRARRQEAARSTIHGLDFEDEVCSSLQRESQRFNDEFESTKDQVGAIPRCKVGDCVVILGAETAAPGGRIVFEAKDDRSYNAKKAREDLQEARENRCARVGVFVWSRSAAPEGTEPLSRWGCDIVVLWDPQDLTTDVFLKAAVSLARLMVVQEQRASEQVEADIDAMESAISAITRDVASLEEISTWANMVKNSGEKIFNKTATLRKRIELQISTLTEHVQGLRNTPSS